MQTATIITVTQERHHYQAPWAMPRPPQEPGALPSPQGPSPLPPPRLTLLERAYDRVTGYLTACKSFFTSCCKGEEPQEEDIALENIENNENNDIVTTTTTTRQQRYIFAPVLHPQQPQTILHQGPDEVHVTVV